MRNLRNTAFSNRWWMPAAIGLAFFVLIATASKAQVASTNTRAVRLSSVDGDVQVSQANQILADPALANTPLFEGNQITTKDDGRAELQFDDGSRVRIPPNSSLVITVLRPQNGVEKTELLLNGGLAYFELQGDTPSGSIRIRFGDSAVTAAGFSVLRINLDNLPGELAVFSGNAHLEQGNAISLDLHGGESVTLNATDPGLYNLAETIEPDSWDAWNADRDQELTSEEAARTPATSTFENSNNPAWGDLDANGNWYNVPGEGYVWSPYVASGAGWEPYGCGHWVWTPQFGYVWVSCESWGYLPYSSGYWNWYGGFGWGWAPGFWNPWWCRGGWGSNVGKVPVHYEPPKRPHGGPIRAPGVGSPIHVAGSKQPYPVVSYNRVSDRPTGAPVRHSGAPVTIAGSTLMPLKPIATRPPYNHESVSNSIGVSRPAVPYQGFAATPRPGYVHSANQGGSNLNQGRSPWVGSGTGGGVYHPLPGTVVYPGSLVYGGGVTSGRPSTGAIGIGPRIGGSAPGMGASGHVSGGGANLGSSGGHIGGGGSIGAGAHVGGGNMGGGSAGGGGHVGGGSAGGGGHVGGGSGAPAPSGGHH
jgi:hypothetical protein